MTREPRQCLAEMRIRAGRTGLLKRYRHQPRGVAVAAGIQRRSIDALPGAQRRRRPAAVLLLRTQRGFDNGLLLLRRQESR